MDLGEDVDVGKTKVESVEGEKYGWREHFGSPPQHESGYPQKFETRQIGSGTSRWRKNCGEASARRQIGSMADYKIVV